MLNANTAPASALQPLTGRYRVKRRAVWLRDGRADMIRRELADANFNWESKTPNLARAEEIISHVHEWPIQLEADFGHLRDSP